MAAYAAHVQSHVHPQNLCLVTVLTLATQDEAEETPGICIDSAASSRAGCFHDTAHAELSKRATQMVLAH